MGMTGSRPNADSDRSHHTLADKSAEGSEDLETRVERGPVPDNRPTDGVSLLRAADAAVTMPRGGRVLAIGLLLVVGGLALLLVLLLTPHTQVQASAKLEYMDLADTALRLASGAMQQHARRGMVNANRSMKVGDPLVLLNVSRGQLAHNFTALSNHIRSSLPNITEKLQERRARRWDEAICFINALIASEKLALAGLQIEDSVAKCKPARSAGFAEDPMPSVQAACAADVTGVYASFSAAGSYLAGVATACPEHVQRKQDASCAQDQLDIQYGLGTLASALSNFKGACSAATLSIDRPIPEGRSNTVTGLCVVNVAQAAAYIGHAVTSVYKSVTDCANTTASSDKASCSSQVSGLLQSFFLIMAYLSNAAELCGDTLVAGAGCSSHVNSLLAGFMEVSAGASASRNNCGLLARSMEIQSSTRPR